MLWLNGRWQKIEARQRAGLLLVLLGQWSLLYAPGRPLRRLLTRALGLPR